MPEYIAPPNAMQIVAEDPTFVVVTKASGFLSVPGRGTDKNDCVTNRLRAIYADMPEMPAVHRLDMDTSGLLVVARTADAHRHLSKQFQDRDTEKHYVALLDGPWGKTECSGTIELPFRLDLDDRRFQIYDEVNGKIGVTHWRIDDDNSSEAKTIRIHFHPITGRTHQLRVHAANPHGLGRPIVGDPLYGNGTGPGQMRLHASQLGFRHPVSEQWMEYKTAPAWW